jgi:hypothetical protein
MPNTYTISFQDADLTLPFVFGIFFSRFSDRKSRFQTGESTMETGNIKEQAHQLLNTLPESATWEDLMYRIYVRQAIEAGLKDSDQGRTVDVKEVRKRFGLSA